MAATTSWWDRPDISYSPDNRLLFAGEDVKTLANSLGTPLYLYSGERISANVARLREAMAATNCPTRLLYAMKANNHPEVLQHLRNLGVGLDVCSPGEVRHALKQGFLPTELSFTAGCLSTSDYRALANWPNLWVNADSLTAIRRLAQVSPGREIGLRINPAKGLGYADNPLVRYSSERPTKFGIYADAFEQALELAESLGLSVTGLHCHAGSGFLAPQMEALDQVLSRIGDFLKAAPNIREVNLGGGLGVPLSAEDQAIDLSAWAALIRRHFAHREVSLTWEPGDYLIKDAGILLTEITQVETKGGVSFVGVNAGFNLHPEPAFYNLPLEPAPVQLRDGPKNPVTIAGNINEALDLWARDFPLSPVHEGDLLAFLNAGAYGASMASAHCLRRELSEKFLCHRDMAASLDAANREAWEKLYSSTPELIWGKEPLNFLADYKNALKSAFRPPVRLLDAGSGEGRNLPFLLSFDEGEITALDSSPSALAKIPWPIQERVILHEGLLTGSGLPAQHFDAALLLDVAETLPHLQRALCEVLRVLKPGGVLVCNFAAREDGVAGIDMSPTDGQGFLYQGRYFFRFFSNDEASAAMCSAGFIILSARDCTWQEEGHPGFRAETHSHTSHVLLAQRPFSL